MGATVPTRWPGATVVILASGPSLTLADVEDTVAYPTIAISDTFIFAPHASVLYAPDPRWWRRQPEALKRPIPKYALRKDPLAVIDGSVDVLNHLPGPGLSQKRCCLKGSHAGIQAINLAVLSGATRIVLLGYDMKPDATGRNHFFGEHPDRSHVNYVTRLKDYDGIVPDLAHNGVQVVNASRDTAITTFPRLPLRVALGDARTTVH